jgi:flagellar M-ring protein FliF
MAENAITTSTGQSRLEPLKKAMSHSAARQLLLLVGVAAAVAFGVAVVLWSRGPSYALLYAGLEQKDAAAMTQALQAAGTPYRLGADGASIMVPASELAAAKLKLAAQGLPEGVASTGIAQQAATDSPFGMSDLAERTRYQQMLETDLGKTIASLQSVRTARVHLALPQPSAFIRENHPASASVLLTLFPGRSLGAGQVAAIVHLVSSSVPGLDASDVSVIDQQGQLLTSGDPGSIGAVSDARLRLATRMENAYAQRIEDLLTPLVGPGRVRAQVSVDLNFSHTEKASETFDPKNPALRSEQTSSQTHHGASADAGVPGALSNQPPNAPAQPTAAKPAAAGAPAAATADSRSSAPVDTSSSATRNYELDHTISHVSDPAGRLARLTVAVLVDNKLVTGPKGKTDSVPFTPQEIGHLTALAKNAVGFDAARGDSVSVINQPFHQATDDQPLPPIPFWQRPGMLDLIKQGGGVLIALVIAFGLLRPLLRGVFKGAPQAASSALPAPAGVTSISARVADDPSDDGARLEAPSSDAYEQRIRMARRMVDDDPRQVAQVVKNWVNENGG